MAFDINNFKEVGGPGNSRDGGQVYSLFSDTDTLGTMMVSGYADALAGKFNTGDLMCLSGTDGAQMVHITDTAGVITFIAAGTTGIPLAVSNPSAIALTARTVHMTSASATPTPTLADGAIGQLLNIIFVVDDGSIVLTPANALGWATITFADAGDSVQLEFTSGGWALVGQGGLTTGPLTA